MRRRDGGHDWDRRKVDLSLFTVCIYSHGEKLVAWVTSGHQLELYLAHKTDIPVEYYTSCSPLHPSLHPVLPSFHTAHPSLCICALHPMATFVLTLYDILLFLAVVSYVCRQKWACMFLLELIPPTVNWLCRCWTYHNSILASCFDVWLVYLLSMSVSRTSRKSKLCYSLFGGNRKYSCMSYFWQKVWNR